MLSDLKDWFADRSGNRRQHQRAKKTYQATYADDETAWQPAIGVDISDGGMCVLTQRELPVKELNVRATLSTRAVEMRCVPVWHNLVNHNGKPVICNGLKFVEIEADDWDIVMRWISRCVAREAKASQAELASVCLEEEDVARLLPGELVQRLCNELVKRQRLAPTNSIQPLVQLEYGGVSPWRGRNMHRMTVHSTVTGPEEQRFSTRFLFDELGEEIIVLN